tara:strand:- start:17 stop:418 length:402 start_codon:yes stop_codon:yes gene_type:complete
MYKVIAILFSAVLLITACEPGKNVIVNVEGDWKFSEYVQGKAALNPQNKSMVNAIISIFENGSISLKEGKVEMLSPKRGNRTGTYTLENGKLDMAFGDNNQVSLNVMNEENNLIVLFNEGDPEETGKIILVKK